MRGDEILMKSSRGPGSPYAVNVLDLARCLKDARRIGKGLPSDPRDLHRVVEYHRLTGRLGCADAEALRLGGMLGYGGARARELIDLLDWLLRRNHALDSREWPPSDPDSLRGIADALARHDQRFHRPLMLAWQACQGDVERAEDMLSAVLRYGDPLREIEEWLEAGKVLLDAAGVRL